MPTYSQENQPIAIETPLGKDKLLLTRIHGTEALSKLFHFTLDCLAQNPIDFDQLMGKSATVRMTIPGSPQRYVNGIVSSIEQGSPLQGPSGGISFYQYRLELSPQIWLCGLRQQSRVFQDVAVPDVLRSILHDEWGFELQNRLTGKYPARDFCVQYRETDLNFVQRLMEEEGICFYFEHTEKEHRLILADDPSGHSNLAEQSSLIYDAALGGRRNEARVLSWTKKQSLQSTKITLRDHSFQLPTSSLEAAATIQAQIKIGQVDHKLDHSLTKNGVEMLEHYDHLGDYAWRFDGVSPDGTNQPQKVQGLFQENQRVTDLRAERRATAAVQLEGTSLCGQLLPGYHFTLQRHFNGDGDYLLTEVEHKADLESAYLADAADAGLLYENRFQAIPKTLPFRPPLETPRPRAFGSITALVVGPKGGDIFVDRYGRVKVKFYWDREMATGPQNSCWLRVSQIWAGNRWGAFFWPRVGHEVIITFIDGNPDRPLITGSVYNENHVPPFDLPDNKTLSGIKSNTSSGGGPLYDPMVSYSGFVINDEAGKEYIELHGEKHIGFCAEETQRHDVFGPHRLNVNGIHSVHVGSLPGGSGSGGGSSHTGHGHGNGLTDDDHPYIYTADTPGGKIGVAFTSTCGVDQGVILGAYSTLTVGDYLNLVVNPAGMIADLGMAIPGAGVLTQAVSGAIAGLGSPALGYTNVTMGSQTQLSYGTNVTIARGAKAPISESGRWSGGMLEPGEAPWALATLSLMGISAAFITAGTIWACAETYEKDQTEWVSFVGAACMVVGALEIVEVFRATANQIVKAKAAATAATVTTANARFLSNLADVVLSVVTEDPVRLNEAKLIKGNVAHYCDAMWMIGADEVLTMFAGTTADVQSSVLLLPSQVGIFVGDKEVGPRQMFDLDEAEINVAIGPADAGSQITMQPGRIGITVGMPGVDSSITLNEAGITLQSGPCKIVLTVEGAIDLITPAATISLTEGALLMNGDESVSVTGEAISLVGSSAEITCSTIEIVGDTTMM